jgi:hypothetical protein
MAYFQNALTPSFFVDNVIDHNGISLFNQAINRVMFSNLVV